MHSPKQNENLCSHKIPNANVNSDCICNHKTPETTQMSLNWGMEKQTVAHPYTEIYLAK